VSPGIAIGPLLILHADEHIVRKRRIRPEDVSGEITRFEASLLKTRQQIQALTGLALELASPAAGVQARTAFAQKADACRTAALTLGSPRLEQLISDALALLAAQQPGAERAMGQASYWLERVAEARRH